MSLDVAASIQQKQREAREDSLRKVLVRKLHAQQRIKLWAWSKLEQQAHQHFDHFEGLQIGADCTRGLGAGGRPGLGLAASASP